MYIQEERTYYFPVSEQAGLVWYGYIYNGLNRTGALFNYFLIPKKENVMNIEDVKQIPIADYLHSLGYSPVKQQGNGLWYKSPLREEHEPSFKVNTDRNLWYDFDAPRQGRQHHRTGK